MVKTSPKKRPKKKPKKQKPKDQPIPSHINKGDPVLYMLQRLGDNTIMIVDCIVTSQNKTREQFLLNLFKDKAFRMSKRIRPPKWYSPHQVKFGITNNLQQRINDICDNPFESGVTEWRKLSSGEMAIAHNKFWWWKNRGKVYFWGFMVLACWLGTYYLITFFQLLN